MKKRKICVINGKRGGFNALLPTMRAFNEDPVCELQVVLTDMHLSKTFGHTIDYAKKLIKVSKIVPIGQVGSSARERTEALGRGLTGMAEALESLAPDIVLLLGDRSETLIATFAALQLKIPVAHIQGGEISGNIDGIQRHAITKLSHLHFTETKKAAKRVEMLGEESWRIHYTGAPYIDFIKQKWYTPEHEVREKFNLKEDEQFFLVLMHPVTTEPEKSYAHMKETLSAIAETGIRAIIAYPCSDQGYQGVIDAIEAHKDNPQFSIHQNIPAHDFIGLEACTTALIGNSSAGIYEAPYVYTPAVNIGKRQEGRERESNIIEVMNVEKKAIIEAIHTAMTDQDFREKLMHPEGIYGDGRAYERIVKTIKEIQLGETLFEKKTVFER